MKEKISEELLKIIEIVGNTEYDIYKLDSSIFVRESEDAINNAILQLNNLLKSIATNKDLKKYEEKTESLISKYNEKLNFIYDEFYCQYKIIQNELQDANLNQRIATISYQKIVNEFNEENPKIIDKKFTLKMKNKMYKKVVDVCNKKLTICSKNFKKQLEKISTSLDEYVENYLKNESHHIINFNKYYEKVLTDIESEIDNINENEIINSIKEENIDFIAKILLVKEIQIKK